MAELNYVNAGERIGAHTINGIIDALGGPSIPSDGDFTKTSNGSLFRKSYSTGNGIQNKLYEFLDVKYAEAPSELSCGYKMIYINLGKNLDFAKKKLDTGSILCFDGDSSTGFELSNSNFYTNGVEGEDEIPNFYDGYVCTKLSALQKFTVDKGEDEEEEVGYGDGTLYGWKFKAQKDDSGGNVFVITNEYEQDNVIGFLSEQGYSDVEFDTKRTLAVITTSPKGNVLIKIPNDIEFEPDEDIRFRLRGSIEKNEDGQKRIKVEYYQGYFLANDKDADTGVRWNNHQFTDITPNPVLGWHTLSVSNWTTEKISEKIPVYLNLTATYEPATGSGEDFNGQFNVSLEAAEEGRSVPHEGEEEGTNSLCSTYVIGQIDFEGDIVDVKQNILGEQTNIELFNDEAISAAVDDIVPEVLSNYLPKVDSEVPLLQLSSVGKYSYEDEEEGEKDAYEIYQFHNLDNQVQINENRNKYSDILIRTRSNTDDKKPAIVEYLPLSALSASSAAEISVDTDIPNQTSSLQKLSNDNNEWYQLYNFNNTQADLDAKIWTIGDLDSSKSGKVGKLIDPSSKALLSVDILVRDNSTKQLKYMNLSVDSVKVDTYAANTKVKSIAYGTEIVFGQYTDQNYLTLGNFATRPNTKLSGLIKNNGLVDITDENTWVLTKKYDPRTQMMELTYDKLQLSVDLSAISSAISCDTDATPAQKSIEKNNGYIQLYDFDAPNITTKKTTLDNLSATYDLLDTNDAVLVRSGTELKYKRFQIETKLPGGGGQTSGYTGTQTQATTIKWNTDGQYKIELWGKDFQYENGLLKSVGAEKKIAALDTVGYSGS